MFYFLIQLKKKLNHKNNFHTEAKLSYALIAIQQIKDSNAKTFKSYQRVVNVKQKKTRNKTNGNHLFLVCIRV